MTIAPTPVQMQSPVVKITGTSLTADEMNELVELRVERSIGVASRFEMRFRDPEFRRHATYDGKVGSEVEIGVRTEGASAAVIMKGEITEVTLDGEAGEQLVSVVGYDRAHRLNRTAVVDVYLNVTYGDVISRIAGRNGLQATTEGLPTTTFPHLTQAGTDLALLDQIAAVTGADWYVDGTKLVVKARPASGSATVTLTYGQDVLRASVRRSVADETSGVTVRSWDPKTKRHVVGTATPPTTAHTPRSSFAGAARTAAVTAQSQTEAQAVATAIGRRIASSHRTVRCDVALSDPRIVPGGWIELDGMGAAAKGPHHVTSVEHVMRAGRPLEMRVTCGGLVDSSLVNLFAGPSGPAGGRSGVAGGPLGTGVTIGIVTNNDDTEQQCRVKLKLPALDEAKETDWARVVVPDAGPGRGWRFVPEINDEVLVAFEHGDLRRPYVIGSLWNGQDAPPTLPALDGGKVVERTITSRSGHVIRMSDATDPPKCLIELKLADGKTYVKASKEKIEVVSDNKDIELRHTQGSIVLKGNGDITLTGANITLNARQNVKIKGVQVEVTGDGTVAVKGPSVEVKASASATIEGGGVLQLKGAMVKSN